MKKQIFFIAAAAIILSSCSGDGLGEAGNGNAIGFRVAMDETFASRSTETTTDNLKKFNVTAIYDNSLYFKDVIFSKGSGDSYNSNFEYLWPGSRNVDFYAYSYFSNGDENEIDSSKLGTVSISATEQIISGFTPEAAIADQIDPVTAYAQGNRTLYEDSGVPLTFRHILSQIQIKAKNTNKVYKFEIKAAKIANVNSVGGTWDIKTSSWTQPKTNILATYTYNLPEPVELTAKDEEVDIMTGTNSAMLLPQQLTAWDRTKVTDSTTGAYLAVLLRITTTATGALVYPPANVKDEFGWALVPINTKWDNNRYIYTLDFSNGAGYDENGVLILSGPILCSTTVTGWEEAPNSDIDFN